MTHLCRDPQNETIRRQAALLKRIRAEAERMQGAVGTDYAARKILRLFEVFEGMDR